ncbi:PREDICTED: ACT domain-containing protein ACR2-like [Nelumbo nucifera]|uniref:ACT domain-containing protein ACR n=2 Tax=Nelumbo nucifera TaxID=4432 RepID=A0A822Y4N5_NELNU|nr:PREDICTED: ACT domain-containing protein ACR2-like [Nelumbo nucifera]DAD27232.1 TPA_asm: hypothetical protein HUJ06_028700 [Nelumbo nucifera]
MKKVCWPYFDPEFENFTERIHGPSCRVCIDNESFEDCTIVKVDSVNKQGLLLQVVQALTEMNLFISKSYISSDAEWFMDVFHVTDEHGNKLTDQNVINRIQQVIAKRKDPRDSSQVKSGAGTGRENTGEHTAIELTGTDRPGLFSEISAVLKDLKCNVVEAHAWSHNERLACVAYISDQSTDSPIDDPRRLATIEEHLATVLGATINGSGTHDEQGVKTAGLPPPGGSINGITTTNVERRLHQLMFAGRDFDGPPANASLSALPSPAEGEEERNKKIIVTIESCNEKRYSVVTVECKDRPKLMFDTVCTLTDMQYVIFHASISPHGDSAFQEYYIRHINGCPLNTESEKQRVIKCLEAALERRVCEGVRLKLCANNRIGLLSDITRLLREYGLAVVRADVETQGEKAVDAFYVRDISGNEVDMKIVESMKREMEALALEVKNEPSSHRRSSPERPPFCFSFGDILKSQIERFSHHFIPIKWTKNAVRQPHILTLLY